MPTHSVPNASTDICLLLEGTWPYVRGGVSSWINQMILGMPEITFSILFIGGSRTAYSGHQYAIPDNVKHIEEFYLEDTWTQSHDLTLNIKEPKNTSAVKLFYNVFHAPEVPTNKMADQLLDALVQGQLNRHTMMRSQASWDALCTDYNQHCNDPSFIDFFWTLRTMQAPLFTLIELAHRLPKARAVHAISTGYAGFMGCILRKLWGCNFILSEHGIYTKERKIDLAQAAWIAEFPDQSFRGGLNNNSSYMRVLWIRFFERLSLLIYACADPIISLYEGNRQRQILDGAAPQRTQVIPNGINLLDWQHVAINSKANAAPVIGLIGRIVPIKDIKTFIRSMRSVVIKIPQAQAWIVGPEEEDPAYVNECRNLVNSLGLQKHIMFLGFQNIKEILPKLDIMVLSSISEAQPLVILEAWAAGTPVVATDMGACRELIYGITPEDQALGSAGEVVAIADPHALAQSICTILSDPTYWQTLQANGLERVKRFYGEALMLDRYRVLYHNATRRL